MKFKPFQIDDYAAAAMSDGLVLAHDTGLGKSLAAVTWPLLKCGFTNESANERISESANPKPAHSLTQTSRIKVKSPVLIVAPGDLHDQLRAEFKKFYGIVPVSINSQEDIVRLSTVARDRPRDAVNLPCCSGSVEPCIRRRRAPRLPPGFYLTSYTRLAVNGVKKISALYKLPMEEARDYLRLRQPDLQSYFDRRLVIYEDDYATLGMEAAFTLKQLDASLAAKIRAVRGWPSCEAAAERVSELRRCYDILRHFRHGAEIPAAGSEDANWLWQELIHAKLDDFSQGIGETRELTVERTSESANGSDSEIHSQFTHGIKCVYSPSGADLSSHLFECVVIDEGVKMKGACTQVGRGIRQMCPKYRLVLTATPVKNRLPDIFFLAWWAAGGHAEATARWPYAGGADEQEKFAETFMLSEFNKTKAAADPGKKSRRKKLRPEICNIHLLWKALGPIVLRRRKQDIGQAIVRKLRHVYRVPMGLHQRAVYRYHLAANYLDCNMRPAPGAKLQALRVASAAPDSHLLDPQPGGDCQRCCSEPDLVGANGDAVCRNCGSPPITHRSHFSYTPKVACALTLIRDILRRGEQAAVFSAFNDPSDILSRYLGEAGVDHYLLDGRMNQAKRGLRSAAFNGNEAVAPGRGVPALPSVPVCLAGIDSMAEGHNWDNINNIILTSYTWAADKVVQAINRAHRLTSRKDVNLYVIICDQSADRVLEDNINEKTNSSELAIDGKLLAESTDERSLGELLRDAMADFKSTQDCPNEHTLSATWPALRAELRSALSAGPTAAAAEASRLCAPAQENRLDLSTMVFPVSIISPSNEAQKMDVPIPSTQSIPSRSTPAELRSALSAGPTVAVAEASRLCAPAQENRLDLSTVVFPMFIISPSNEAQKMDMPIPSAQSIPSRSAPAELHSTLSAGPTVAVAEASRLCAPAQENRPVSPPWRRLRAA